MSEETSIIRTEDPAAGRPTAAVLTSVVVLIAFSRGYMLLIDSCRRRYQWTGPDSWVDWSWLLPLAIVVSVLLAEAGRRFFSPTIGFMLAIMGGSLATYGGTMIGFFVGAIVGSLYCSCRARRSLVEFGILGLPFVFATLVGYATTVAYLGPNIWLRWLFAIISVASIAAILACWRCRFHRLRPEPTRVIRVTKRTASITLFLCTAFLGIWVGVQLDLWHRVARVNQFGYANISWAWKRWQGSAQPTSLAGYAAAIMRPWKTDYVRLGRSASANDLRLATSLPLISRMACNGISLSEHDLESIARHNTLAALNLQNSQVAEGGFRHIGGMTALSHLELNGASFNDAGMQQLGGPAPLFFLSLSDTSIADAELAGLSKFRSLRYLELRNTRINGSGLFHLRGNRGLQNLDLSGTQIARENFRHLTSLPSLQRLDLIGCDVDDQVISTLTRCANTLTSLSISSGRLTETGWVKLSKMQITSLTLGNSHITKEVAQRLKAIQLKYLTLWQCRIDDDAVADLALKKTCTTNVRDSQLSDKAAAGLHAHYHVDVYPRQYPKPK